VKRAAVSVFDELDSTSAEARRRYEAGSRGPVWLIARRQTAGYGRRGRAWTQALGDLAATFLTRAPSRVEDAGRWSFVAGLAVHDALCVAAPGANLALKWPNDVLLGGGKVAGLLLELWGRGADAAVAFGVGVNVVSKPADTPYPTARLLDVAADPPAPEEIVTEIDAAFSRWRARLERDGFAPIREAWLERAAGLGERLVARLPDGEIEGRFETIDADGALVLDCADGPRRVAAGDVFFSAGAPRPI